MSKILIDRATIEQALEALEAGPDVDPIFAGETEAALRAALAEPVQEPVSVDRCANCLRPKGEHQGDMCPRPYTTVWSAWDYEAKPVQEPVAQAMQDAAVYGVGISRDGKRIDPASIYEQPAQEQAEPSGYCTLEQLVVMQRTVPSPDKIAIYTAPPKAEPAQEPVGYLPAYELNRLQSGHDGRLRSAKFGASALDGDVAVYTAPPPAPVAQQEPVADPFADIRDKRMGELNAEQTDRATELWLREQIGPWEDYWYPHLQALFRIIDRLRAQPEPVQEPIGWLNGDDEYADFMHRELARIHQQRGSSTPKFFTIPVYTKPFRSKPLTDEEMLDIIDDAFEGGSLLDVVRAVERKVRGE